MLANALSCSHRLIAEIARPGDAVIDATVGNGHDTLFLAKLVGVEGRVFGFDIQQEAIARTAQRLREAGAEAQVQLRQRGHESLLEEIPLRFHGAVRGVLFNLGYLPGGDKQVITRPAQTLTALEAACKVLAPGGRIGVVTYSGHPGGAEEEEAVAQWAAGLDTGQFRALSYRLLNLPNHPPSLLAVEKTGGQDGSGQV